MAVGATFRYDENSMPEYNHKKIEAKWQKRWKELDLYKTEENSQKPKCYVLDMFPYPSGEGLHVGHPKGYIATDIYSRYKHMNGFNVLHPMGWDAFGLPAEQFAIKKKIHPRKAVVVNTTRFKEQLAKIGFNYDWEREINTTDPEYYRWTQWIFLKLYEKGLAYQSFEPINWCPSCQTGLANEDLEGGKCERCGTPVEKKPMRQWVLRITRYADRLLKDLDTLDWPDSIKESERNWIGRSEGIELTFPLYGIPGQKDSSSGAELATGHSEAHSVVCFTTRPDTLFGATFVAISADLAKKWINVGWRPVARVAQFVEETIAAEAKRLHSEIPEKDGIFTGIYAKNPANGEKIPVWIANYILSGVGSGAIMAVPAHDTRDHDFAKKFDLPIRPVIYPVETPHSLKDVEALKVLPKEDLTRQADRYIGESGAYTGEGFLINSRKFDGESSEEAKIGIAKFVNGKHTVNYKLRDWVFSRQRYWGEPIPVVGDDDGNVYLVDESDLPVILPEVESYAPTGTGESPLADIPGWVDVEGYITVAGTFKMAKQENAPADKETAVFHRETNTMPQWAGSSWYHLRYIDPKNTTSLVDPKKEKYWSPVDMYVGGAEHATRHLIYARFWHKFLYDIGVVGHIEPFMRLQHVGLIIAPDGRKMSKRYGNIINPDDVILIHGADALRLYEMFMGPFDQQIAWSTDSMAGVRRFIERIWRLKEKVNYEAHPRKETGLLLHQTTKKVGEDIDQFSFNTAIAQLMTFLNHLEKLEQVPTLVFLDLIRLLAPFTPHVAEELWSVLGHEMPLYHEAWPTYDSEKILGDTMTIAIQVNGKLRDTLVTARDIQAEEVKKFALDRPAVKKWLEGKIPIKVIYVPGKIVNIVL